METALSRFHWRDVLVSSSDHENLTSSLLRNRIQKCNVIPSVGAGPSNNVNTNTYQYALMQVVSDATVVCDRDLRITYCNPAARKMYGLIDENVIGRSVDEVLPIFLPEEVEGGWGHENPAPEDTEAGYIYQKDRRGFFIKVTASVLVGYNVSSEADQYTLVLKPLQDAEASPEVAGESASVSNVQWYQLFEAYPEPIAVITDSTFTYVNAACAELYGAASKDQLVGKSLFEFALVPYHNELRKRLEILANGEPTRPTESRIRRLDGHVRYVRTYSVPIEYAGQKAAQIVISDITEQKRALMALERSEKRFWALFERAGIGIILATHDRRILETNPAFQKMVGYTGEELRNMNADEITHSEDVHIQSQFYRQIHEGKIDRYRMEKRYLHRHHRVVWGSLTMTVIRDDSRAVEYMIGMVEDISDRKRTEAELLAARSKAEEMTLLKSSFLTNMSHEIRTPLTGIIGFAAILQDELSPAQSELVRLIEQSGQRLLQTLDAILDLSMLESGTLPFDPKRLNVVDEVLTQIHLAESAAQAKGLYLKLDYQASDIYAYLDRDYLERILTNLISNAIKFTREGGVVIRLKVDDDDLLIDIEDTGVGISDEFVPMLFEAFRQESTGKTRTYEGTGLGLTIVKRLVERMGGEIDVVSALGAGSIFTVRLHDVVIEKQSRREIALPADRTRIQTNARPSVLVLDDNQDARRLLQKFLEGGYHVELVGEEKDALECARQHPFDVVLMDINLGGERTGVDALRALRHLSGYEDVPVVALTAYAVTGDRERFLSHGFNGYLGKPLTKQELYDVIANVLA